MTHPIRTFVWGRATDYGETIALLPSERTPIPEPDWSHGVAPLSHQAERAVNSYGFLTDGLSVWSGEASCVKLHDVEVQRTNFGRLRYLVIPKPGVVLYDTADRERAWLAVLENETSMVPLSSGAGSFPLHAMEDFPCTATVEEPTILLSHLWQDNYAHTIFDTMTRLWPWGGKVPCPVLWERTQDFHHEMAEAWFHSTEFVTLPAPRTRFKTLYLPTPRSLSAVSPAQLHYLRQEIGEPCYLGPSSGKLLVSRAGAGTRRFTNEDALLAALPGFIRICPAEMTVDEQARIFAHADTVVLAHGAAQANTLWCRPGIRVVELVPEAYQHPMWQYWSKWLGHRYGRAVLPSGNDWDMEVPPDLVHEALKALA